MWQKSIPLLAEEGWRDSLIEADAPGWSVRRNISADLLLRLRPVGLALRAPPSAQPALGWPRILPLLCEEGYILQSRQSHAPLSIFRGDLMAFFGSTLLSTVIAKNGVNISSQVILP